MTQRVFIYGSCVSRDAVELWDPEKLELAGYIARQSLISAVAPPSDAAEFRLSQIASSFQRRMLRGDVESSLLPALESAKEDYDVILWDLTDERNGVQRLPDGGWVTRLRNFQKEQLFRGTLGDILAPATPEHSREWNRALDVFLGRLDTIGVLDRLVLNDTRWATSDDTGAPFTEAELFLNAQLDRMVRSIKAAGIQVISPHPDSVVASSNHRWDRAPFHYIDATYTSMTDQLLKAL